MMALEAILGELCEKSVKNAQSIKQPVVGIIVKVTTSGGMDEYTLDTGFTWGDSAGRWKKGDRVKVSPYIMGTVRVEKA